MGTHWVKVAASPLPKGIPARMRAGMAWSPGDIDAKTAVLVDDAVLAELEADEMLRVKPVSAPANAEGAEVIHLPNRLPIDPKDAALEKLARLKRENEALKAADEIAELEAENARLRDKAEARSASKSKEPRPPTTKSGDVTKDK